MLKKLVSFFVKIIFFFRIRQVITAILRKENELRCRKLTNSHTQTMFGPAATIFNLPKNSKKISIGKNTLIDGELLLFDGDATLKIGDSVYIGKGSRVWAGENVEIGDHVFVAHEVTITDSNAHQYSASERAHDYQDRVVDGKPYVKGNTKTAPIVIEKHAWINFGVGILKGVRIGEGAIVGAGSLVIKDVPPWTFAAGTPARVIRQIEER